MPGNYLLLSSLLVLLIGSLVLKKLWLGAAMALVLFVTVQFFQQDATSSFIPAFTTGIIITAELAILLFGAYLFYKLLRANNHFDSFSKITSSLSSPLAVIMILCYFLGSFMEGVAGFGIPAMLIAPMLLALGFRPITCIVLPLAANTTAVTFGALGTPLKIGLGIFETGTVTLQTILLNFVPAIILPFLLAYLFSKTEKTQIDWRKNWKMLLGAGFIYAMLYMVSGLFTIEYVSVIAGIIGLLAFVFLCIPKRENPPLSAWLKTFYPYILFILLLLAAKFLLAGAEWKISPYTRPVSYYQPGIIFILAGILYYLLFPKQNQQTNNYLHQAKETFYITVKPILTILLLACYAQVIRNDLGILAQAGFEKYSETTRLFINPLMGITGSFLSGSATMSNLIFGNTIQSALEYTSNLPLMIALLHTGSAIGNAISLQNILMVKSVINEPQADYWKVVKFNVFIVIIYLAMVMITAFILGGRVFW